MFLGSGQLFVFYTQGSGTVTAERENRPFGGGRSIPSTSTNTECGINYRSTLLYITSLWTMRGIG